MDGAQVRFAVGSRSYDVELRMAEPGAAVIALRELSEFSHLTV